MKQILCKADRIRRKRRRQVLAIFVAAGGFVAAIVALGEVVP
jgi:hypothetical protein